MLKEIYIYWNGIHKNLPRIERLGLGNKIEKCFLDALEISFVMSYSNTDTKIVLIGKAISKLDLIKFFLQLAWESKLIPTNQYSEISIKLNEAGRQLGGWKKGLKTKNSHNM